LPEEVVSAEEPAEVVPAEIVMVVFDNILK